jgi:hypothetical protein
MSIVSGGSLPVAAEPKNRFLFLIDLRGPEDLFFHL